MTKRVSYAQRLFHSSYAHIPCLLDQQTNSSAMRNSSSSCRFRTYERCSPFHRPRLFVSITATIISPVISSHIVMRHPSSSATHHPSLLLSFLPACLLVFAACSVYISPHDPADPPHLAYVIPRLRYLLSPDWIGIIAIFIHLTSQLRPSSPLGQCLPRVDRSLYISSGIGRHPERAPHICLPPAILFVQLPFLPRNKVCTSFMASRFDEIRLPFSLTLILRKCTIT